MPQRGGAHIAGSAIAPRFGRFADSPVSVGVPCHNRLEYPFVGSCGDRYWGVDDRRTISTKHAPATIPVSEPSRSRELLLQWRHSAAGPLP
jgi:hypothetical protein